jgi:putative heme-binding domain-containing protein
LTLGEPDDEWRGRLLRAVEEHFPDADRPAARECATLLAYWNPAGTVDRLLAALEAETDREQAIHYAFCLCAIREPWSLDHARKLLSWFDASSRWSGGASFDGYLEAMRMRVLPHFDAKIRSAIAREGKLGAVALAALVGGSAPDAQGEPGLEHDPHDVQAEILRALQAAYARLGDDPQGLASRKTVLQTVALSRIDGVANWLASIAESKAPERDVALIALARRHRLRDQPLFVKSLARTDLEVPEACAQALIAIDAKPDDADTWAHVLDAARKLGVPRGWSLLQVAAHWLGKPALQPKAEEWAHTLQQYDVWFSVNFPSYVRAARPEAERPSWDYEHVLAFLEKSGARAGSRGRGAQVFQQAACASCHVVSASDPTQNVISAPQAAGAQWGPDLTTVGRRFSVAQLLESIQFPSRNISDQYRTSVAETTDERRVEGRIVAQDEQSITLLSSDGARHALQRNDIRQIEPSSVSPMPEGLLDALTLEEIKDLFAFLRSDDRIDEADATSPPWTPLFSGASQRTNWTYDGDNWRLQSDVLIGRADNLPQSSYLVSKSSYRDFEIEFDVYMQNGNSGFQYRSAIDRSKPDPVGYQADIGQDYWGSLYASDGRGMIAEADPKVWRAAVDLLGWNHFFVRVVGDRHEIEINGVTTVDARDGEHKAGIIGFQLHEGMKMEVRFANIRFHSLRSR